MTPSGRGRRPGAADAAAPTTATASTETPKDNPVARGEKHTAYAHKFIAPNFRLVYDK